MTPCISTEPTLINTLGIQTTDNLLGGKIAGNHQRVLHGDIVFIAAGLPENRADRRHLLWQAARDVQNLTGD